MNSKIELLNDYIKKCDSCSEANAKQLEYEIIAVYKDEIKNITENLDSYMYHFGTMKTDYFGDLKILKAHLINHKANLENNLRFSDGTPSQIFNINQSQNTDVIITVSLENTIKEIEAISNEKFSQDEKDQLEGKLTKLQSEKDKIRLWEKTQSVLKWIADKGIEVGIAALPYISEILKNTK